MLMSNCNNVSLLSEELPRHYENKYTSLRNRTLSVPIATYNEKTFTLTDTKNGNSEAHFANPNCKEFCVIDFEAYLGQIKPFSNGVKRCDFILVDDKGKSTLVFNEMTSSLAIENISKPITGFEGGKIEKMREQLASSVKILNNVSKIRQYMATFSEKVCLRSIKVSEFSKKGIISAVDAFRKNLYEQARVAGSKGIKESNKELEDLGFTLTTLYQFNSTDSFSL